MEIIRCGFCSRKITDEDKFSTLNNIAYHIECYGQVKNKIIDKPNSEDYTGLLILGGIVLFIGLLLIVLSLFIFWPLLIIGAILGIISIPMLVYGVK